MDQYLLLANAASTWFMVGVIWLVQIVVYPSFRRIDPARFREAMLEHQARIGTVVILPMLVELTSSLLLLTLHPERPTAWLGCVCVGIWGFSTILVQVPLHARLATRGYDDPAIRLLVRGNWLRTMAWSAHALILIADA